jgi:DNA-binding response OmpR family regulator
VVNGKVETRRGYILIVEDEADVADVIATYARRDGFESIQCRTVKEALAQLAGSPPTLMIVDVGLPDGSGFDVLRESVSSGRRIPAIVLSARGDESDRIVGLELGADDYMTKPFSPRELMARVRALLRRLGERPSAATAPQPMQIGGIAIDPASHEVRVEGRPVRLTPTEFRILAILAGSPGEVLTRAILLDRLNDVGNIYERTLDRHINNLRKKIETDVRNPSYVITVYGVGYKLRKA